MKQVVVIGAGPAGLTAAYMLSRKGYKVVVHEASGEVGGMARSFKLWGRIVDLGPHRFFSKNQRVNRLWHDLVGNEQKEVTRLTRIYHRGDFFDYPLKPTQVLEKLGLVEASRCGLSYGLECMRGYAGLAAPLESFEDWTVAAFGRRLYERFFEDYSEKLWGIPCNEIDSAFAAQRIKRFNLWQALTSAMGLTAKQHRTLAESFAHPSGGAGIVYERMAKRIVESGGIIQLRSPVAGLTRDGNVQLQDGSVIGCDHVVSTMPLTTLCRSIQDLPESLQSSLDNLSFRCTVLVYLKVEALELFPDQWLYVQSADLQLGRVTNFNNWADDDHRGFTILALEYWCDEDSSEWDRSPAEWRELAVAEVRKTGLLKDAEVSDSEIVRIPKSYPVYRRGFGANVRQLSDYLRRHLPTVVPIGRYGAFKYNNQDHSILMGILAAENIVDETGHDLWSINTDYEDYQEGAIPECNDSIGGVS